MRVPLSWLRDLTPLETRAGDRAEVAALAADFDALGLVVEGVEPVGEGLSDVVLALVLEIGAIPGADKIRHIVLDAGAPQQVEVVCGAWNFEVGDVVALAPVGAVLPGDFRIRRRRIRDTVSNGMICSGRELRLSDDADGILVLGHIGADGALPGLELGRPLVEHLGASFEPDVVFDLAIEGNRPDCLSIAGVARDLAARRGLPLQLPEPKVQEGPELASSLASVAVLAPELCHRLSGKVLTGVKHVASPATIARRLTLAGMRPIDSVVDASNYVMIELGQPTHPYDLDQLGGHGLQVRAARPGEELVTLDGVRRVLGRRSPSDQGSWPAEDCLICDAEDNPVGLAGIMGGRSSEITAEASRVLLEVASFVPLAISRTARRVALRSEASVRFERGVDRTGLERAALRFCELVISAAELAHIEPPIVASGLLDAEAVAYQPTHVRVRAERVGALLGTSVAGGEIAELLEPLGFVAKASDGPDVLDVEVPPFRPDVTREADVTEEVARRIGYDKLPSTQRRSPHVGRLSDVQSLRRRLRRILAGLGAHEAWTMSVVDPADQQRAGVATAMVRVANPMVAEESALRGGLLPGALGALRHNSAHRHPSVRLFEIGEVFALPSADAAGRELPDEWEMVGLLLARADDDVRSALQAWREIEDAFRLKPTELRANTAAGLHPARSAEIVAGGKVIGLVGEVDPETLKAYDLPHERVGWLEFDLNKFADAPRRRLDARPVSRFPSSDVDLAFQVADSVSAAALETTLRKAAGELCESISLFDVYRGPGVDPGTRSLAYRLRFCALDRTMTDAEVAALRAGCIAAAKTKNQAALRA